MKMEEMNGEKQFFACATVFPTALDGGSSWKTQFLGALRSRGPCFRDDGGMIEIRRPSYGICSGQWSRQGQTPTINEVEERRLTKVLEYVTASVVGGGETPTINEVGLLKVRRKEGRSLGPWRRSDARPGEGGRARSFRTLQSRS